MNILAINFNHDGAAVLVAQGEIAGYVNTERFSRRKKHPGVRACDIENVLDQAGLRMRDIDLVQLLNLNTMDSPEVVRLHGSNLKETWPEFWIDGTYRRVSLLGSTVPCAVSHHLVHHEMHAAAAYLFSPFESAVSFACDPVGARAYFLRGTQDVPVEPFRYLVAPEVYDMTASALFGNGLVGAGKLMGLAPYGADQRRIDYEVLSRMPPRAAFDVLAAQTQCDRVEIPDAQGGTLNATLAFHAQAFLEFELTRVFEKLYQDCLALGVEPNLCLSGGTALNSVANQRCFEASKFRQLYLHPACGDDGTPIGAALTAWHRATKQPKVPRSHRQAMYSCRTYEHCIAETLRKYERTITVTPSREDIGEAARMIAAGKVIGWFQGASEIGPRALGNRSILADARVPAMKDYINKDIKQRESFRPFAPSVLQEHALEWFGLAESPFMLRIAPLRKNAVPAVTHVDGTARVQTVARADNPRYYDLITRVFELTGVPMVLNTSFNGNGEPIVESPEDAIECLLRTGLDALVFPGVMVRAAHDPARQMRG
jgi:carbamoyltransferase